MSYKLPRNTCPLIDKVIEFIKTNVNAEEVSNSEISNTIEVLEEIRTANSELREWAEKGIKYEDEIYDLEKENKDLKNEIIDIKYQLQESEILS